MRLISAFCMPRRNFRCMTSGGTQQKKFHLQKVDVGQSGSQDLTLSLPIGKYAKLSRVDHLSPHKAGDWAYL